MQNLDEKIERLFKYGLLTEKEVAELCATATEAFSKEENVVRIKAPLTVCGDTHGQFPDLQELFKIIGPVPLVNYLFIGDYVDRGFFSVQNVSLLICLKLRYPEQIHLLRGNHESREITTVYGFYDECVKKYGGTNVWKQFTDLFDYLPIAALIEEKILCVHGGLSPVINSISEINDLDRIRENPNEGAMGDLMWSDPDDRDGWGSSPRGAGYSFGRDVTINFNRTNGLILTARAHQLAMEGFNLAHNGNIVTLFSAPNYCMRCGNKGAVMNVQDDLFLDYIQFDESPKMEKFASYKPPDFLI